LRQNIMYNRSDSGDWRVGLVGGPVATPPKEEITQILSDLGAGDRDAPARLMPLVYDELRRLASHYLSRERAGHTLQPTALVHEAYIRMVDQTRVSWQNRAHFIAVAACMMRRILVDHARSHHADRHGGYCRRLSLDEAVSFPKGRDLDIVALDDALKDLAMLDPDQSRIVEMRFFGGLTLEETAEAIGISRSTVKREWTMAKAWLYDQLSKEQGDDA
jgi:RNA polymerase sigma factor (TIGR02999 family)